ncbi:PQQ-binding-like beta-propeller repeat protein [Nocardia sp. AG03]|uniref:outer membrane protein assembly factor BamB family protein n=1 Tax=Nocardia sp. AG03 TaxID=3025312 RepID=UPI002418337A|nr:PQQ-binding-like beta-propeller repeat protein [Nocardia sp. AG03]
MTVSTSLPRRPDYSRPISAAAILGVVLLVGGVLLGLYSLVFAADSRVEISSEIVTDLSTRLGVFAVGLGTAAVLVLASALRWARPLQAKGIGNLPSAAMHVIVVVEFVVVWKTHIPSTIEKTFERYAAFPSLPMSCAALVLVIAGTLLVLGAAISPPLYGALPQRASAIMAAIGVLATVAVTGVAAWVGDDSRFIDHRTAADGPVPSMPKALGQERFRIDLPPSATVAAGGHGFVVGTPTGITAYDGTTGTPRWHYLRPAATTRGVHLDRDTPLSLTRDDVVVTYWYGAGWIAFDASSGETLWTDSDFSRDAETGLRALAGDEKHTLLARADGGDFRRYDARTGTRMWSAPAVPDNCRTERAQVAVTSIAVYQVMVCRDERGPSTTVRALDATTGAITTERAFPTPEPNRLPTISVIDDVVSLDWSYRTEGLRHLHFVSPTDLTTAEITDSVDVLAADSTTVLTSADFRETTVSDRDDPTRSRTLPLALSSLLASGRPHLLLADELISIAHGLHTWQRPDLTETTPAPLDRCKPYTLLPAPGATLVICESKTQSGQLIGTAPR